MRRVMMLAAAAGALAACWAEPEESTTAEELQAEDSVIRAGTVAPDSVALPRADSAARDTAPRLEKTMPLPDTAIRP